MHRVVIIGSGGAGKSTLARQLGQALGLPVYHLDSQYWHPGWKPTEPEAWTRLHDELCLQPRWIMDGNYGSTLDRRLGHCDTVIFLDLSRWRCLAGVLRRWWQYRGRSRPELRNGCVERLTFDFLRWIWNYPKRNRPGILRKLSALNAGRRVFVLRSRAELRLFLLHMGR